MWDLWASPTTWQRLQRDRKKETENRKMLPLGCLKISPLIRNYGSKINTVVTSHLLPLVNSSFSHLNKAMATGEGKEEITTAAFTLVHRRVETAEKYAFDFSSLLPSRKRMHFDTGLL